MILGVKLWKGVVFFVNEYINFFWNLDCYWFFCFDIIEKYGFMLYLSMLYRLILVNFVGLVFKVLVVEKWLGVDFFFYEGLRKWGRCYLEEWKLLWVREVWVRENFFNGVYLD